MTIDDTPVILEGRVYDMPYEDYRKSTGLSYSMIKELRKSPQHLLASLMAPPDITDAQRIGIATHDFILGSRKQPKIIVRPPEISPYSNHGKKWRVDQVSQGNVVITDEDMKNINGMRNSILEDAELRSCFEKSTKEVSCFAELPLLDKTILCKGRIDLIPDGGDSLLDLKTTSNASDLDQLAWNCLKYSYHLQAALYLKLFNATKSPNEAERANFVFVFVETEPPYGVRKIALSEEFLDMAHFQLNDAFVSYLSCLTTGVFPSYDKNITFINPPRTNFNRYVSASL
jgi:hypothetical protein